MFYRIKTRIVLLVFALITMATGLLPTALLTPVQAAEPAGAEVTQNGLFRIYLPGVMGPREETRTPERPAIANFTASATSVQAGQEVTLSWNVTGATSLRIEPTVGDVTGRSSVVVKPAATTTYSLVAGNAAGEARLSVTITVGTNQQPAPPTSAFFLPGEAPTRNFDAVYDAQGGLHITYISHSQQQNGQQVHYAYCAPGVDCDKPANWAGTVVATGTLGGTQIEVTRDGRPRLVYEPDYNLTYANYVYAECNANCTSAGNWSSYKFTTEPVELISPFGYEYARRDWFTLDPQGRPRMIVPMKNAAYYGSCDSNCDQAASWTFTEIRVRQGDFVNRSLEWPVLRFSADGRAHILTNSFPEVFYLTCAGGCEQAANWEQLLLGGGLTPPPAGLMDVSAFNWDMELEPNGRLVIVVGGGQLSDPNKPIRYTWTCTANCTSLSGWSGSTLPVISANIDLAISPQGVPYWTIGGKRASDQEGITIVAYCLSVDDCYGPNARWTDPIVDTQTAMEAELPVGPTLPIACGRATLEWSNFTGRILFDPAGKVRLFATGVASATCYSGLGEYIDRWGTLKRTRDVDIWIFINKARIVPVS